jgi:hypothetical protein
LNLFTKSQYTATWINFSALEMTFVRKVENLETWQDVLRVTDEIYEYSKNEQQELEMHDFEYEFDENGEEVDTIDSEESEDSEDADDEQENGKSIKSKEDNGDEDESYNQEIDSINRDKDSSESLDDQYDPSCVTDDNFRRNESMLIDEKCKEYVYATIPKPILKNIVTPAKRVHELYTSEFKEQMNPNPNPYYGNEIRFTEADVTKWVNEFKSKNERYIGLLAKEFEMRKAAKAFSKSKICDTGDIDINKLSSYKFDDNIFRKVMLTPKGKNHGLVLLLDKSGSMSNNMAGSIEQILVLTMFCRKVNIPFIVYGFGDSAATRIMDFKVRETGIDLNDMKCFEDTIGDIDLGTVSLREYLNSSMSNVEFTKAVRNLILVKKSYEGRTSRVYRPESENLSNTPLTQALVATAEIMKKFRKDNNLDLTSLVIVHDGDADWCNSFCSEKEVRDYSGDIRKVKITENFDPVKKNVVIMDRVNKLEFKYGSVHTEMNNIVLDWFRKVTNSKVFGFYLTANPYQGKSAIDRYYYDKDLKNLRDLQYKEFYKYDALKKQLLKQFKNEKFVQSFKQGYDSFFIVSGGSDMITENEEIEVDGAVTASKLKTAFMKFNKKKAINRVLVSRFITGIAA